MDLEVLGGAHREVREAAADAEEDRGEGKESKHSRVNCRGRATLNPLTSERRIADNRPIVNGGSRRRELD